VKQLPLALMVVCSRKAPSRVAGRIEDHSKSKVGVRVSDRFKSRANARSIVK